jgi:hypothetical protein
MPGGTAILGFAAGSTVTAAITLPSGLLICGLGVAAEVEGLFSFQPVQHPAPKTRVTATALVII